MKYLRLLRLRLHHQLNLIHQGEIQAAQDMGPAIEETIAQLEREPPPENDASHLLHAQCAEINELVLEYFEEDVDDLRRGILRMQVERNLSELNREPDAPPSRPDSL